MKLILKEYLASLRERDELDAILPDLLSQLGLTVFSRPGRGTRQDGVDVGAVGSLDGGPEKVYLFAIKPGDLTRQAWDGDALQSLRPTLNEILDAYLPNRLPAEHRDKDVVICICCGGDVQEQVRAQLEGFKKQQGREKLSFEEWNGDKLADLIQSSFLREDLLPGDARSRLRKALALLDEPEASYTHFACLIASLSSMDVAKEAEAIRAVRQMSLCLWILFAWARQGGNVESAYRSGELALLHSWKIAKAFAGKTTKAAIAVQSAFSSTLAGYQQICTHYLTECILPHVDELHALSSAVRGSHSIDVNLKLFDVLGRLVMAGLWSLWAVEECTAGQAEQRQNLLKQCQACAVAIKQLVSNNPALLLPIKDDQAIELMMALLLLTAAGNQQEFIGDWLSEMLGRAVFAYETHGPYPCNVNKYSDLLERKHDDEYRKEVTSGSVLYPAISLWAALLDLDELYEQVADFKKKHLDHCNLQFWYPDEKSEDSLYTDADAHGAVLSHVAADRLKKDLLAQVFSECEQSPHFNTLSAVQSGLWPLVIVACRHYRLPPPIHLIKRLHKDGQLTCEPHEGES